MLILTDLPESTITDLKKKQNRTEVDNAVLNGIPISKGHGKIVDTKNFKAYLHDSYIDSVGFRRAMCAIEQLETIIEADNSGENEG